MGALIAGIIVAAVGATTGFFSTLADDARAREDAANKKQYIEDMYKLNKARAEKEFAAAKEEAERNAQRTELQADLTDQSLDVTEQGLSNDINAAIDGLYLEQTADAMSWNAQAIQMGSSEGASYAALGASGVRAGSSLSDAVLMESAVNESQLQFSQDSKRRSDDNNLAGVLNTIAGNKFNIQQNRIGADFAREDALNLRNSYLEGGHNWNLYQNQLESLKKSTSYQTGLLDREYDQHAGWNSFWNSMIALHGGAAKGFSTGYNIGNTVEDSIKPTYKTK